MAFSRGSSPPRDGTRVSAPPALAGRFLTPEPPGEPECSLPSLRFSHSKRAPDTCLPFSLFPVYVDYQGSPGGTSGEEPACQYRRRKRLAFNPWVGKIPWRRAWPPPPVFLPGESHAQRSVAGYRPWGRKESDTAGRLSMHMS